MIVTNSRLSYANLFVPKPNQSGHLKYSAAILIPKSDTELVKKVKAAIATAQKAAIEAGKFNAAQSKLPTFKGCIRDGDAEFEAGQRGEEYKGMYFINATNNEQPGIVNKQGEPILDQSEVYSGCWAMVDVNFSGFNKNGGVGIGAYINNVMKIKDDDRIDGRQSAASAFASHFEQSEEVGEGELL